MYIGTLRLANFRNYEQLEFHPSRGLNVLLGRNAQGKSAVLEAVYLLATSKSHRTSRDQEMIRIGETIARVVANVERSVRNDVVLEIVLSSASKKIVKINTVKHPKIGDIVRQLNAVIFSSSDIDMVKGEPSRRRRFLNLEISQISPRYVYAFGRYKRVLDQRNNLLREARIGIASASGLEVWDRQLATYGATVIAHRNEFVNYLSGAAANIYASLTEGAEKLNVVYKPSLDIRPDAAEREIEQAFARTLAGKREVDLSRGTTTVGPHRDDLLVMVDGLAAREYASQGQQRTAAIAMKLAEIGVMEESAGESPVVLLDDVMGELDETRRAHVLSLTLGRCQTFVTTTHLTDLGDALPEGASVFEVETGKVMPR